MEEQQQQQIQQYVGLVLRRKKIILFFLLVSISAGLLVYLKTPKVYQSTALLIYQRASINPGSEMTPNVKTQTEEMVATLTQQVTSRSSLESIVKQFDIYSRQRQNVPMEDVVEDMRSKHIKIQPEREGDVFKVSFDGEDPRKVMLVTNAIAAQFIEENLRYREERAAETSDYVADEMNLAKVGLDKKESAMRDYKLQFYNELPQQLEVNMLRLSALQEQSQNARDSAQDLERTKVLIQEQINLRKDSLAQMASQDRQMLLMATENGKRDQLADGNPAADALFEVTRLQRELGDLLSRYTEKHPGVRRVKKQLAKAEEQYAALLETGGPDTGKGSSAGGVGVLLPVDSQLSQLDRQLRDVDYSLKKLRSERGEIKKQIGQLKKWIEMTPVREAEWTALTRDYTQLYEHYQRLVVRNLEAESAESLERKQKGSQFKMVDSAYLPEKPIKPDFKKMMLMAVAIGLGIGGGLVLALEMVDTSFKEAYEIESFLGMPVVCSLPRLQTPLEKKAAQLRFIIWSVVFTIACIMLLGVMAYLFSNGKIII